jgi:hypothetical protein
MYLSQGLMAFGGTLFLGPLLVSLIGQVIANPGNLVSFSVLFGLTQNLGGLLGSSLLGTFLVVREKFHSSQLTEHLTLLDPLVAGRVQAGAAAFARVIADPAARETQSLSTLASVSTREANLLAYNDVFLVIAVMATLHAAVVFGRAVWLDYFAEPVAAAVPAPPAPARPAEQITD